MRECYLRKFDENSLNNRISTIQFNSYIFFLLFIFYNAVVSMKFYRNSYKTLFFFQAFIKLNMLCTLKNHEKNVHIPASNSWKRPFHHIISWIDWKKIQRMLCSSFVQHFFMYNNLDKYSSVDSKFMVTQILKIYWHTIVYIITQIIWMNWFVYNNVSLQSNIKLLICKHDGNSHLNNNANYFISILQL